MNTAPYLAASSAGMQNGKTYYVQAESGAREAYVGSANLTHGGMEANHEATVIINDGDDGADAVDPVLAAIKGMVRASRFHARDL